MKPLTNEHKKSAFISAITGYSGGRERWEECRGTMMNDTELDAVLRYELGLAGGSSGCADTPNVSYQGAGLKIWAAWGFPNSCLDEPILQGKATLQMAREVFNIGNPDEPQMSLF